MNSRLIEISRKGAAVWRAATKGSGLSQREIARTLSISQARVSRIANGLAIPLAHEWIEFANLTGIPLRSYVDGFVDEGKPIQLVERSNKIGLFRIPERYAVEQGSAARMCQLHLRYLRKSVGEHRSNELITHLGMDPDYFVNFDHMLNIRFNLDLMDFLVKERFLTPESLVKFSQPVGQISFYGTLAAGLKPGSDLLAHMTGFCELMKVYEVNHVCAIEQGGPSFVDLSMIPTDRMARFQLPELREFFVAYFRHVLMSFLSFLPSVGRGEVRILQSRYQAGEKLIYRIILPIE